MIAPFYKKSIPAEISLSQFLKDYEDLFPLVERAIDSYFGVKNGFNSFLKIRQTNDNLEVISLLPKESGLPRYLKDTIPDNGFNWVGDLTLFQSLTKTYTIPVKLGASKEVLISFEATIGIYAISGKKTIKFPDDYFLKGYSLFAEKYQQGNVFILSDYKKGANKAYSVFHAYWVNELKKIA